MFKELVLKNLEMTEGNECWNSNYIYRVTDTVWRIFNSLYVDIFLRIGACSKIGFLQPCDGVIISFFLNSKEIPTY